MTNKYESTCDKLIMLDAVGYFLFSKEHGLVEQEMRLDIPASQKLGSKKKKKEGTCFRNASTMASTSWDYVEGFVVTKRGFFEHGWNVENNRNLMVDVTFPIQELKKMLSVGNFYIEVVRYSFNSVGKWIKKTKGEIPFFMYDEELQELLNKAREEVEITYPQAPYLAGSLYYNKKKGEIT